MRKGLFVALALVLVAFGPGVGLGEEPQKFVAHLAGENEVPPVDTEAQGQAKVREGAGGTELDFKLNVANIENVTQSHIHCGASGVNGPVVVFLFGFISGGVTVNGILAQGTIDASDVIPRPDSAACPGGVADLDDLRAKIASGDAYVNVHTVQFPGGEVRGQLQLAE